MKNAYKFLVLFFSLCSLLSCMERKSAPNESTIDPGKMEELTSSVNTDSNEKSNMELLPTSTSKQIIHHSFYSLSYVEKYEQAEWVAYELKKGYLKNNDFKRPYFVEDPQVVTGSADWKNYKNSGYDKGHLVPAGDMEFDLNGYTDTFLTSNIAPQDHNFNAGIWNRLEQKARFWAEKYNGVYVVAGGVLVPSLQTIGREQVAVPEEFFKIIMYRSGDSCKMIAFLIPNKSSDKPLFDYAVSVDLIEKKTGIDFFPALDDVIESKLEKIVDKQPWFTR